MAYPENKVWAHDGFVSAKSFNAPIEDNMTNINAEVDMMKVAKATINVDIKIKRASEYKFRNRLSILLVRLAAKVGGWKEVKIDFISNLK